MAVVQQIGCQRWRVSSDPTKGGLSREKKVVTVVICWPILQVSAGFGRLYWGEREKEAAREGLEEEAGERSDEGRERRGEADRVTLVYTDSVQWFNVHL